MLLDQLKVHLNQSFNVEMFNTSTNQFHQYSNFTKQFTASSSIQTKKSGFSIIQQNHSLKVIKFQLFNSKRKKIQIRHKKCKMRVNTNFCKGNFFFIKLFLKYEILGTERENGKEEQGELSSSSFTPMEGMKIHWFNL